MSEAARFPAETVLVVDDEESVRRTFREWLVSSDLDVNVVSAADAESALRVANQQPIDLAVLDWNLGSGSDGLLIVRHADGAETYRAYSADGKPFAGELIPFADSIAASVVSLQEPNAM